MPERKAYRMPNGRLYLFPGDVTEEEVLRFAEENFPVIPPVPSHEGRVDTEVDAVAPESAVGEETGPSLPPTPSHKPYKSLAEKASALEWSGPATTQEPLHVTGAVTPMDRALSGVSPAPPPSLGKFFEDPGPYFADIASEVGNEVARAATHPIEFTKDVGTVLTAPSGAFNMAFGGAPPSMTAEDPLAARALERGTAQALSFLPALLGTMARGLEEGPFVTPEGEPTRWQGLRPPRTKLKGEWQLVEPGNLDLDNRPEVEMPDGAKASIYSMSINVDGNEVLIPRVSEDGRLMTEEEATKEFERTGNHLGVFRSPEAATRYAKALHKDQAKLGKEKPLSTKLFEQSADIAERVQEIDTGARTIFDVKDPSQTSEFLVNVFGEQAPIIGGLVGASLLAGPGSLIPASAGLETGSIAQEMQARTGSVDADAAAIGGLVAGALEATPIMLWLKRTSLGEGAAKWVASRAISMMAQAPEEASTEYAQTLVEALTVQWLARNRDKLSPRDWQAAVDVIKKTQPEAVASAATGGIAGFGFGALSHPEVSPEQERTRARRQFEKVLKERQAARKVAAEGSAAAQTIGERVGAAPEIRTALETGGVLPPVAKPPELPPPRPETPTEPQVPPPEAPSAPELPILPPPEPPVGAEGGAAPEGAAPPTAPPEGQEGPIPATELPEGEWSLNETDEGYLIEGQHSVIHEIRKGGNLIGTVQMRLNPDGKIVIVDDIDTKSHGYEPGVLGLSQLRPLVRDLFPTAEFIAGQTTTAEERAQGKLGKWVTRRLRPKTPELPPGEAPGTTETTPEAPAAPTGDLTKLSEEELYAALDEAREQSFEKRDDEEFQARYDALQDELERRMDERAVVVDYDRMKEIEASYSADRLADHKRPKARKAVKIDGKPYINVGGGARGAEYEARLYEEMSYDDFVAKYGEDAVIEQDVRSAAERFRNPLGTYHGRVFYRGKSKKVLAGPERIYRTPNYKRITKAGKAEAMINTRIIREGGKPFEHAYPGSGANIRDFLDRDWSFNDFVQNMTRILDQFELTDNDLVGLSMFFDGDSGMAWNGFDDLTEEQWKVYNELDTRVRSMMAQREIPDDLGPDNVTDEEAFPEQPEMTNEEIYEQEARNLDRFGTAGIVVDGQRIDYKIVGDAEGPFWYERVVAGNREKIVGMRGETFSSLEAARLAAKQDMKERLGVGVAPQPGERGVVPDVSKMNDNEIFNRIRELEMRLEDAGAYGMELDPAMQQELEALQAEWDRRRGAEEPPAPEPEEETAAEEGYSVGDTLVRKRDGMKATVINTKNNAAGIPLVRLEFEDGHKHTFRQHEIDERFARPEGAAPETAAEAPEGNQFSPDMLDQTWTAAEMLEKLPPILDKFGETMTPRDIGKIDALPAWDEQGTPELESKLFDLNERIENILKRAWERQKAPDAAKIPGTEEYYRAVLFDDMMRVEAILDKTGRTIQELASRYVERYGDEMTDEDREYLISRLARAVEKMDREGRAQLEEAEEGGIKYLTVRKGTGKPKGEAAEPAKSSKTAENVIEATPEEAAVVREYTGEPQSDGFTKAQRDWILKRLKSYPDPMEPELKTYAVELRVPDDGTFFLHQGGVEDFRKLVAKKTTVGGTTSFRVKPKKASTTRQPLPFSYSNGWKETIPITGGDATISPNQIIIEMADKVKAAVKNRINKAESGRREVPERDIERLIDKARNMKSDVIRIRGLTYPAEHDGEGDFSMTLETDKGTRLTDMTLSFDKLRFMEEATGFDEMKTDLSVPASDRLVGLYRDGRLVGVIMPFIPKSYRKNAPNPAVEESEGGSPPKEGTKANRDRFRDFDAHNGDQGIGGGSLSPTGPPRLRVLAIGLPELVKIAKALGKGRFPRIRRILLRDPGVLGYFSHADPNRPLIRLKASIFVEPNQAAATLAHEIGHWVDFIPDRTFARGNLLGRLMSVIRYMKHTASMLPDLPGEITPEDRKRLRAEAKAQSREEYWEEVEETIRKEFGITPEDILNIWRQYTPDVPQDLQDFIKGLDGKQKAAIVRAAMQGLVAPELERFKRTVVEKTGKKRRVKKVRYKDVEKVFRELLIKEMRLRHLVSIEEIREELWALSLEWRPLPEMPTRNHIKYRKSGEEIYADAVSAFLNDPATFQRIAPKSFQMFLNYLHRKPEFYDTWQMLQQVADNPEALRKMRAADYEDMVARGERSRAEDLRTRLGIGMGIKYHRATIGTALASGFIDRNEAWYRLRRLARKKPGDHQWHEENDPIYWIEELAYANSAYAYYLDRWQAEVMKPLQELGIDSTKLGVILGLRRAGRAKKRGGRAELANPLGIGSKDARETLAQYLLDQGFTTADKRLIVEALQRWQEIRKEVIGQIEDAGMFTTDLTDLMRDSVGSYATYKVRTYIEDPDPHVGAALGYIHRQIGTLSEIGNPVVETILKDLALARAAHRTQTIKAMIQQLKDAEPDSVQPAFRHKVRGISTDYPNPPEGMTLIRYLEKGKVKAVFMNTEYAKALLGRETGTMYRVYRWATGFVRAVMVTHNPFWAIWNTQRDFRAMMKQVAPGNPVTSFLRATYWTLTSAPEAFRDVARDTAMMRRLGWMYEKITGKKFDGQARTVRAMMRDRALIQTGMRFYTAADITEDEAANILMQTYGLTEADHHTMVRNIFGHLAAILSAPGQYSERLIKIAGYRMLKANQEKLKLSDKEVAHLTRSRVGTPDIMRRGDWHNFTNSLFLFSNVAKEGYRAAWDRAKENPVDYAAKTIAYDFLPAIIKWMAVSGFLGAAVKGLFDRIPEYHKRTYTIIPIAMTSSGKAVYMILPHDHVGQLVNSATYGALNTNEGLAHDAMWEIAQNLPWSHGSLHPFIESTIQWALFATGVNPQDWYRGRPVIPERVWESQDIGKRWRYMLGNTMDNVGLRVLTDLTSLEDENGDVTPEKVADWLEKGSGWPVAGSVLRRFVRVSDRGIAEEGFRRFRNAAAGPTKRQIDRDQALKEMLEFDYNVDGYQAIVELERRGVDPAYQYDSEKELARKLDKRLDTMRLRYHGTEYDRLRSYANTEDKKRIVEELEAEIEGQQ